MSCGSSHDAGPVVLVLGAGRGTRFNAEGTKLLALLRGQPLLAHVIDAVRKSGLSMRLVLASTAPPPLVRLATQLTADGEIVRNTLSEKGIGTSVAAGMSATQRASGWLVLPGDMPNIGAEDILRVARSLDDPLTVSARPTYRSIPGYPIGFSHRCDIDWNASLIAMGLQLAKARAAGRMLDTARPGVVQDVDLPADLAALAALAVEHATKM